jgi:hypothetical protein
MADYLVMKRGLYYRPNEQGYTASISEAGRYPEAVAVAIMESCDPGEITICPAPDDIEVGGAVVPLDVAEAAATAVQKMADNLLQVHPATFVAEAIMGERERCARIVERGLGLTNTTIVKMIRKGGDA